MLLFCHLLPLFSYQLLEKNTVSACRIIKKALVILLSNNLPLGLQKWLDGVYEKDFSILTLIPILLG